MENQRYNNNPNQPKVDEERHATKVVNGTVTVKKKSAFDRLFDPDDVNEIKEYLIYDVIIPAVKNIIFDSVTNGASMALFHETRRHSSNKNGGPIPYNRAYNQVNGRDPRNEPRRAQARRYDYDDLALGSYAEADAVLREMEDSLREYPFVTVGYYKELVGLTGSSSDYRFGWTDLRNATIDRTRNGEYIIRLPKAMPID